jgi:hypothetical protein
MYVYMYIYICMYNDQCWSSSQGWKEIETIELSNHLEISRSPDFTGRQTSGVFQKAKMPSPKISPTTPSKDLGWGGLPFNW